MWTQKIQKQFSFYPATILLVLASLINPTGLALTQDEFRQKQDAAQEQFLAWQTAMFQTRQDIARKQLRLFYQNMKVPPLPPLGDQSGATSQSDQDSSMMRIDVPLPLPTDTQLTLHAGEPSASFQVGVEGKALSFIGASYTAGVSYSASDNKWMVGDARDFRLGLDAGPAQITGTYQYHASSWTQPPTVGSEISADLYMVKGSLGYNSNNELSVGVGYDLAKTPKALSFLAEASIGVQGQVSAPVKVQGLTRGKRSLTGALSKQVAKLVMLLKKPVSCPHCAAKGELDCPTCGNTRQVTCPLCKGQLEFECTRCEGGGYLYCPICDGTTTVSCSTCRGTGQLRCSTCGGSGQVTVYESETRSRQVRKLLNAGFDENGQPFEEWGYETEYYTAQVPKNQTCSSCGGTGDGGQCSNCGGNGKVTCNRCDGSGTVYCNKCGGSGKIKCRKCHGTGKITCPDCRGKPIRCPMCKGKAQLGK